MKSIVLYSTFLFLSLRDLLNNILFDENIRIPIVNPIICGICSSLLWGTWLWFIIGLAFSLISLTFQLKERVQIYHDKHSKRIRDKLCDCLVRLKIWT